MSRRSSTVLLCLALFVVCRPAYAQDTTDTLQQADELYKADKLIEAEQLYQRALKTETGIRKRQCFDRLLAVYIRLGRPDRAIELGQSYETFLRNQQEFTRRRELLLDIGSWYIALGHGKEAETYLLDAISAKGSGDPLPPGRTVIALTLLAQAAEKYGDHKRALEFWLDVERTAVAALAEPKTLDDAQRVRLVWHLADSYRFQKQPDKAATRLRELLPVFDKYDNPLARRDTLYRLGALLLTQTVKNDNRHLLEAEKALLEALGLHDKYAPTERLTHGDLTAELVEVYQRLGQKDKVAAYREKAAEDYQAVLDNPQAGQPGVSGTVAAFWKMQLLYERTNQYQRALQLTITQAEQWAGSSLLETKLQTQEGGLKLYVGKYTDARVKLRAAVADLERQAPPNLFDLPVALNNLALAEQATDNLPAAEEAGQKCLALYRRYGLPDDPILIETYNLLGACAALRGQYAVAIERFREGVARCQKLGTTTDPQLSNLLLNIALLLKGQSDLDGALDYCRQALTVYRRFAEPDALGLAAFDAAEANILAARGQVEEAYALTGHILDLCKKHDLDRGPLVITARHCRALYFLSRGKFAEAEKEWATVLKLQTEEKQSLLQPRTLNYLGLTASMQDQLDEAERYYKEARDLQRNNPRSFPSTHFITLWLWGELAEKRGRGKEARTLLEDALTVVEKARLETYGDARLRAIYFAQFAPAVEDLVEWGVRDGDLDTAFLAISRSRSRTLLDQLQMANVDPRDGLKGPKNEKLLKQEVELREKLGGLRARAQMLPLLELDTEKGRLLLKEFDDSRAEYSRVWGEILNASPVYRSLTAEDHSRRDLEALRTKLLGPKTVMLVYHIGRERSHLLLFGDRAVKPEAFELTIPGELAKRLAEPANLNSADYLRGVRGVVLKIAPQPPLPDAAASNLPRQPLMLADSRKIVEQFRRQLADPDFSANRGVTLKIVDEAKPVSAQRPELLVDVVLPPAARARLKQLRPDLLVIIPDGPLQKLPLEALPIESGAKPRYLLDELPPTLYAPSPAALTLLAERQRDDRLPTTLLTLCNPTYPKERTLPRGTPKEKVAQLQPFLELAANLPPLPGTAKESRAVRRHFADDRVLALEGDQATKAAFLAALPGRQVIHVAAHGFVDERFGNLFGALALTPEKGSDGALRDDGFLSLNEIYRLPLQDCQLAVLSACVTNVGPQQPLEAGVTLANGFLTAGARRVIASQWSVDDDATAALMEEFFKALTAERGDHARYARALYEARRNIRQQAKWATPFYWAPFVLLGPPE